MGEQQINNLVWSDYDTIQDRILYLGYGDNYISVAFNVKLSKKDKDGNREFFHKEYEYDSKYLNKSKGFTIKRNYDFFISFENRTLDIYIQIRLANMIMLNMKLQQAVDVLFNDKYWAIKDKRLVCTWHGEPILLGGLPLQKWISFYPVPIEINGMFNKGIRIKLADDTKYVDVEIDTFMELVYIFSTTDLLCYATNMINYLDAHKVGTNLVRFGADQPAAYNRYSDSDKESVIPKKDMSVYKKKNTSFFDRLDNL